MEISSVSPLEEYKLCDEKAARLEGYIWQTASLFGVGSAVALQSVAGMSPADDAATIAITSILGITFSLVWWRFARRWWSIQYLMFQRMETLDELHGSRMAQIVRDVDSAAQRHRLYLRKQGTRFERLVNRFLDLSNVDRLERVDGTEQHEYRGMREASRLLVCTLVGLWILLYLQAVVKGLDFGLVSLGVGYVVLLAHLWRKR